MVVAEETYEALQKELQALSLDCSSARIQEAWEIALKAYENEEHWTGVPLLQHVKDVVKVLAPFRPDEETIISCVLHHVLQTKYWTVKELEQHFGPRVREIVSGVHLLSHVTLRDRRVSIDDLKLMLMTVSDDIRTILIVLCDRFTLLHSASSANADYARRLAQDALQLFAPVAARLGIYTLKHKLEASAFPVCYPQDAESIEEQIEQVQERNGTFLQSSALAVQKFLAEHGIDSTIEAREKEPYSVFKKMAAKSVTHVLDLQDYYAVRLIVQNDADCYQALGLLHKVGRPVGNRFKDYIAFPKPNGYRSLHTTLAHLPGVPSDSVLVEVQVRTEEMNREAKFGVAAHWMYKETTSTARAVSKVQLQDVLASQNTTEDANQLADHIFVLTPAGDVIELPEGATPLDFAFQVHTDLGIAFRGARVNGSIVSMDYQLENGDIIEILKHSNPKPSPQWLQLLKMASSRSKLKRFLYAQKRPELLTKGREVVNDELRKHDFPPLDTSLSMLRTYNGKNMSMQDREDILVKIGQGSERASALLPKLQLYSTNESKGTAARPEKKKKVAGRLDLVIDGGIPLPNRFAKCCHPDIWPQESLMGVISRKGEVVVHRGTCGMLRNANPERKLRVWWED